MKNKIIEVTMDGPLGSVHPNHENTTFTKDEIAGLFASGSARNPPFFEKNGVKLLNENDFCASGYGRGLCFFALQGP